MTVFFFGTMEMPRLILIQRRIGLAKIWLQLVIPSDVIIFFVGRWNESVVIQRICLKSLANLYQIQTASHLSRLHQLLKQYRRVNDAKNSDYGYYNQCFNQCKTVAFCPIGIHVVIVVIAPRCLFPLTFNISAGDWEWSFPRYISLQPVGDHPTLSVVICLTIRFPADGLISRRMKHEMSFVESNELKSIGLFIMLAWLLSGGVDPSFGSSTNAPHLSTQSVGSGYKIVAQIPDSFTNRIDFYRMIPTSTQSFLGFASIWSTAITNMAKGTTNVIEWVDTNVNTASACYYVLGNADLDTDEDGLSDAREALVYKTNPTLYDSDGDFLSDGIEGTTPGFDPMQSNSPSADMDGDGLCNLDEAIYGTCLNGSDTDGDGTSDAMEVSQGSNPLWAGDGGVAPSTNEVIEISLTVGDQSITASERYQLNVGQIHHQPASFGNVETRGYLFRRGMEYPVTIQHLANNPNVFCSPRPDYDYTAKIQGLGGEAGWVYGNDGVIVHDDAGFLGEHFGASVFYAQNKTAKLHIVKIVQNNELWWFNGEDPGGSYHIEATLTALGITEGTFQWSVTAGDDKVDLNNGGEDSDTVTGVNNNTVTVKGTGPSLSSQDVIISLSHNGQLIKTHRLTVFAPASLQLVGVEDEDYGNLSPFYTNAVGYWSQLTYEIHDQFNAVLPYDVPWNEDFNYDGAQSVDGIPDYDDENWGWGGEDGWIVSPANATDNIARGNPPCSIPPAQSPGNGDVKVVHETGGWYVGSLTVGRGVCVSPNCTWQAYQDHGRHE